MTYRQSEMYNCAKYLKNLPLQSVSSKGESSGGIHIYIFNYMYNIEFTGIE